MPNFSSTPTYIVTGGAGFVGSNLVAELYRRVTPRPRLIVLDTFRSGSFANIVEACNRRGVGPFDGRIIAQSSADADWLDLVEQFEPAAVFHLGAITDTTVADEALMLRENVHGFVPLLNACSQSTMGRPPISLVYASSAATYGTPAAGRAQRRAFPESDAGSPGNVYGFSKWLMECEHRRFADAARAEDSLGRPAKPPPVVGLRYFNVFGPGESRKGKMASMVYQLARQMIAGDKPRVFRDGTQARDQVYVDDVVDCTIAAAGPAHGLNGQPVAPGVYNLGSGAATSFNQIIDAVRGALNLSPADRPTDYFEMPAAIRAFYQDFTQADMTEAAKGLFWRPKHTPTAAMTRYARWLTKGDVNAACE